MTGGQAELAIPLRRQAGQVGMDAAERHIALSDGGAGLEELLYPSGEMRSCSAW